MVTQPDRPAGRGHKLTPTPVKTAALALGRPVHAPETLAPFVADLAALAPDLLLVASYGRILPPAALEIAARGIAFNIHPSLLPLYRGATPLQAAIRDGRTETGVTIIAMDAGMDTGDILVQERTPLSATETYGELHDRLARRGAELALEAIDRLAAGTLTRTSQASLGVPPDEIARTLTRPLGKSDLQVDFTRPAQRIVDLVRSLAPAPLARGVVDGEAVKILAARVAAPDEREITSDDGFAVPAAGGERVVLLRVVPPNRGPVTGAAYRRAKPAV